MCIIVPNFAKIGQTDPEIWRFFDFFHNGGRPFSKVGNFNFRRPNMRHRAKFREDRSNRSGDMADFRSVSYTHLTLPTIYSV